MKLQIDIGNTKLKWRLLSLNKVVESGNYEHNGPIDYDIAFAALDSVPSKVEVVSVIVAEEALLSSWSKKHWDVYPAFAKVTRHCAGVVNGYDDVSQMGPDRWLAMLAAYNVYKDDCIVVDVGSACTIDLVLRSGKHLGGYIVPGLSLMRDALFRDTDRVKVASINYDVPVEVGNSTQKAVSAGLQQMLLGLLVLAIDEMVHAGAGNPILVVTGGDGERLIRLLGDYMSRDARKSIGNVYLKRDLVFEGLQFI